jgi:hypothetical protein
MLSQLAFHRRRICFLPGCLLAIVLLSLAASARSLEASLAQKPESYFERNLGQSPPQVLYLANGPAFSAMLERDSVTLVFSQVGSIQAQDKTGNVVRLHFLGASPQTTIEGTDKQPGISNYFSGSDPAKWQTRVPHFARVTYRQLYPGIDVVFYFRAGQLEYDFQVQPGADPGVMRVRIEGAETLLTGQGDAVISSGHTELLKIRQPHAYQPRLDGRSVPAKYVLRHGELSVVLGHYDRSQELVVDPALAFSIFLGANCPVDPATNTACQSTVTDLAVDSTGIYLTGSTSASLFPASPNSPTATAGLLRTVVVKLDPTGSNVIYTSFIASSQAFSIAVDSAGAAYIYGLATTGSSPQFPLTAGSFSSHMPAAGNPGLPFATKLSPDGATLVYSTFLMQDSGDPKVVRPTDLVSPGRVAVDANGALYLSGAVSPGDPSENTSSALPFPTTIGSFQPARPGNNSLFVMKLNPAGSALGYSTYLGVVLNVGGLAVDSSGSAYVSGSAVAGYPTTSGAYQTMNADPSSFTDAVVTKLSADGSSLVYSTYFGGPGDDEALDLAVSPIGEAVLAGWSQNPPGTSCPPSSVNPVVAKLNAAGSNLVYSKAVCGLGQEFAPIGAVAVDSSGAAYVDASIDPNTFTPPFPLLQPIQGYLFSEGMNVPAPSNGVMKLDTSGNIVWSTFLGPFADNDDKLRIAVDGNGAVYLLDSFLTTAGSFQPVPLNSGTYLAKIIPSLGAPVPVLQPRSSNFGNQLVGTSSAALDVAVSNFGDASLSAPTITISGDYSQTNTCTASISGGQKCDVNVVFKPTAAGTRNGTLTVSFGGGLPNQTVALTGTGTVPTATPSPTSLVFPPQSLNTTSTAKQITIANNGTGPLNISSIKTTGDFAQTNACGSPVLPNSTCIVQVTFTPTVQGKRQGTLVLTDNAPDSPQTIPLTGYGGQAAMVSLSTTFLSFAPEQNVGSSSASTPVVLTNIGNSSLTLSQVTIDSGDFGQTNNCGTVAAGGTCTLQLTFSPKLAGLRSGTLTITDNSITSPENVGLSGIGADFTFATPPGSTTATVSAGQTASYTLTAAALGESTTTISFSCSGLPSASNCAFNPPSATLSGGTQNFTVNIGTTAPGAVLNLPGRDRRWPMPVLALWTLCLTLAGLLLRKHKQPRWTAAIAMSAMVLWIGCGGGGGGGGGVTGTPSGTYTVVVTATTTSGGSQLTHSTNITLVVK